MQGRNRREFLKLLSGAVGSAVLPAFVPILHAERSATAARGTTAGGSRAQLPPRTVALRTQGGRFRFDPEGLRIEAGSSLIWLNMGDFHTTTAFHPANGGLVGGELPLRIPERAEPWHSGMLGLDAGTQYEHQFTVEGVYDYFCQPHYGFGMVGRLVVGRPRGGPAITRPLSELPEAAREQMPSLEAIVGPVGRTSEWASRMNGVLLLLANACPAAAAARAVVQGAGADQELSAVLERAGSRQAFRQALRSFADGVASEADYEDLVGRADVAKETLARAC